MFLFSSVSRRRLRNSCPQMPNGLLWSWILCSGKLYLYYRFLWFVLIWMELMLQVRIAVLTTVKKLLVKSFPYILLLLLFRSPLLELLLQPVLLSIISRRSEKHCLSTNTPCSLLNIYRFNKFDLLEQDDESDLALRDDP